MKGFYSIVKFAPNVLTEDTIAIGLVFFDGMSFRYFESSRKKTLAKSLLNDKSVDLKFLSRQIDKKIKSLNMEPTEPNLGFDLRKFSKPEYFDYLNRYSNGLLQFSKPKTINLSNSKENFKELVSSFFKEDLEVLVKRVVSEKEKYRAIIKPKLIDRVEEKVHTYYQFNSQKNPSIYFNYEIDCIGQNGAMVGAKSLPFDKSNSALDRDISHYFALISTLSDQHKKSLKDNSFYLISREPEGIQTKEHKLWESVRTNQLIRVIDPEESNLVAEEIDRRKAKKFLFTSVD